MRNKSFGFANVKLIMIRGKKLCFTEQKNIEKYEESLAIIKHLFIYHYLDLLRGARVYYLISFRRT